MNKYEGFYQMVKKWTVNDFCTPGIKAEVIIDMLLSEFIEEIVCCGLCNEQGTKGEKNYEQENFFLLAKEFPVLKKTDINKNQNKSNLRNSKVDYLIVNTKMKKFYLVELKTTNGSFSEDQFKIYDSYRNMSRDLEDDSLMGGFCKIIREGKFVKDKDLADFRCPVRMEGSRKYVTVVRQIMDFEKKENNINFYKMKEPLNSFIKYLPEQYRKYEVEIVYISLKELKNKTIQEKQESGIHFIALDDKYLKEELQQKLDGEKKEIWSLTEMILDHLTGEREWLSAEDE